MWWENRPSNKLSNSVIITEQLSDALIIKQFLQPELKDRGCQTINSYKLA